MRGLILVIVAALAFIALCASSRESEIQAKYQRLPSVDETALNLELRDRKLTEAVERERRKIEGQR